ncbi:hypothetical protein DFH09DRAFT_1084671 [Mycena vulgaris]|nr:hypothetical protein DFH09DRAFT_1084671 [Mycena vulgaris]
MARIEEKQKLGDSLNSRGVAELYARQSSRTASHARLQQLSSASAFRSDESSGFAGMRRSWQRNFKQLEDSLMNSGFAEFRVFRVPVPFVSVVRVSETAREDSRMNSLNSRGVAELYARQSSRTASHARLQQLPSASAFRSDEAGVAVRARRQPNENSGFAEFRFVGMRRSCQRNFKQLEDSRKNSGFAEFRVFRVPAPLVSVKKFRPPFVSDAALAGTGRFWIRLQYGKLKPTRTALKRGSDAMTSGRIRRESLDKPGGVVSPRPTWQRKAKGIDTWCDCVTWHPVRNLASRTEIAQLGLLPFSAPKTEGAGFFPTTAAAARYVREVEELAKAPMANNRTGGPADSVASGALVGGRVAATGAGKIARFGTQVEHYYNNYRQCKGMKFWVKALAKKYRREQGGVCRKRPSDGSGDVPSLTPRAHQADGVERGLFGKGLRRRGGSAARAHIFT